MISVLLSTELEVSKGVFFFYGKYICQLFISNLDVINKINDSAVIECRFKWTYHDNLNIACFESHPDYKMIIMFT